MTVLVISYKGSCVAFEVIDMDVGILALSQDRHLMQGVMAYPAGQAITTF